jgi:hypothetical protein
MPERLSFLKNLLEANGYTVIAVPSPPAKLLHLNLQKAKTQLKLHLQ